MNRLELALETAFRGIADHLKYITEDIEAGDTETYDCYGMPVELTLPVHGVPLKGCRSPE